MARRSLSADDLSVRALLDTSSAALLPSYHMEESTSSPRQPPDGHSPPSTSSSSSSTYTIYSGPGGVQGRADQHPQRAIRDTMLTVLHVRKTIKRLSFVVALLFLLLGLMCLVTAGLTLVIPQHTDSAVAQQMVNTLFTMLNIAGVLCIVQGVSWSSKSSNSPRLDGDSRQQYPMWSRTPFMVLNRAANTRQGLGQTDTTYL